MHTTIAEKLKQITVDQKLAALSEISDQKNFIDDAITDLNDLSKANESAVFPALNKAVALIELVKIHHEPTKWRPDLLQPTQEFIDQVVQMMDESLKARRAELISMAEELMQRW